MGKSRALTEGQAREIILHCHSPADDKLFADGYGVGPHSVRDVRLGRTWAELREAMDCPPDPRIVAHWGGKVSPAGPSSSGPIITAEVTDWIWRLTKAGIEPERIVAAAECLAATKASLTAGMLRWIKGPKIRRMDRDALLGRIRQVAEVQAGELARQ